MASLTLENIHKTFGRVHAVDGVSLNILDREFVALLGPSGCGKTTTLRMIAGLELPDSGRILIGDRDVTLASPRDRDIAMVFQDYALYPHMTILDNIGYPLKVRGVPRDELTKRVEAVAQNLQIGTLLERRPNQLSGGQQQRASVARAVVHKAQVFLFDEPLSNLDAKLRLEARAFLKRLQQDVGVTAVYVTHDQAEAMSLADRIVVMRNGHIMQAASPLEVYHQPANTFVASFIGSPPMNLLPCTLDLPALKWQITGSDMWLDLNLLGDPLPAALNNVTMFTMGVRPEHITLHDVETPHTVQARPFVTQPLGSESIVLVEIGSELVSVRLFQDAVPTPGERAWLEFDPARLYFFDGEGERLR